MRVLLIAFGSIGDVNPLVGLGVGLRARGHPVCVLANPHFEALVRGAGLDFVAVGNTDDYEALIRHPDLWQPRKSLGLLFQHALSLIRETYARIAELHEPGETVLAAPRIAFAARLAQEKLGVPLATLVINPFLLRSVHSPPRLPGIRLPRKPGPWAARGLFWLVDREYDRLLRAPINVFRKELGLSPLIHVSPWLSSPDRVLALWPGWFYAPQPDWPSRAAVTGFIDFDGAVEEAVQPDAQPFDRAPIVFTAGTAMVQARVFFANAAAACERLKCPGLLVARYPEQLPCVLTPAVRPVPYTPFGELLPRARAIVHHGGIGTAARALKSGIPQLVLPRAYDQFDNAQRLERLGVAAVLSQSSQTATDMARALTRLLASESVATQCREYAQRLQKSTAVERGCELVEALLPG